MEKVRDEGVYLLENGIHVLLFVGLAADPQWIQDVFGVATAAQIDIDKTKLQERDNPLSRRVYSIYNQVTADRSRTMKLTIVRQRDKLEILLHLLLLPPALPVRGPVHGQREPLQLRRLPLP